MTLDRQSRLALARLDALDSEFAAAGAPDLARARAQEPRLRAALMAAPPAAMATVQEHELVGPGGLVPVRVYRPSDEPPTALLVWFHGGGFVMGSAQLADGEARALAAASGCCLVSVDYRLAPEHPFPAGLLDCVAATEWAGRERRRLCGGAEPPLLVGGDSAGGNLAAAVALRLREREPALDGQLLLYPMLAVSASGLPSRRMRDEVWGSDAGLAWLWDLYAADPRDRADPQLSPLLTPSLAGAPPALVVTAEHDLLRDEGELYAQRLTAAGVPTRLLRRDGLLHGFLGMLGLVDAAGAALERIGVEVRELAARARPLARH